MAKRTPEQEIIAEAQERFQQCQNWEATARIGFDRDYKFANADPDNGYQWPTDLWADRNLKKKPALTVNKTRVHNLQIINDAKQNKPSIKIRPTGGGATFQSAQTYEAICRHIEYISNAENVYDWATTFQVQAGIGYWRVVTDYMSDRSFDQDIYIRRVKDPRCIYLDPDIVEQDGSDARFGFVFEDLPREQFEAEYPKYKGVGGNAVIGNFGKSWFTKNSVRIAEYYRRSGKPDKLVTFVNPATNERVIELLSDLTPEGRMMWDQLKDDENSKQRAVTKQAIEWFKIVGNEIVDKKDWPGKYVPIVRVVGEETVIDGVMDRKGHTRNMKDAQRMYNYWTSNAAEFGALQTKSPYMAAAAAIENLEDYWNNANINNASVLVYNHIDEDGQPIPPPTRVPPPVMSPGYVQGMQMAQNEMMMASGQYQSQFGQNENATSGKAINERQRQGDNATYHFIDALGMAVRFTGKILIDLVPKVYDVPRVIQIMADDGEEQEIQVDPNAPQAIQKQDVPDENQKAAIIFNPKVGEYDVMADIGPGYATRRQEAWNAFTQIASQNPDFMKIGGDLMFRAADFPMADELAERWARTIPDSIKGKGLPEAVQQQMNQMQQQIQSLTQAVQSMTTQNVDKTKDLDIRKYEAETKRLTAIGNSNPEVPEQDALKLLDSLMADMLNNSAEHDAEAAQPAPQGIPAGA